MGATLYDMEMFIELPELGKGWEEYETKNSKKEKIDKYFKEYKRKKYTYDLGDDWIHDIIIEKTVETDKKLTKPICIKAKMAPLPEDCGGPYGYEELRDILSDKSNESYDEMREWVDDVIINWNDDREYVDIEKINKKLEDYKEHAKFLS